MYEAFKSFDHDKLNAAIQGRDQVLKLYRKARAGRSDKCWLQLLQCMERVDTNERRESVLMESRFQEGPAGQSTFTDITSTPLPRRGLVGGRGGVGGEEGQQLQQLRLQGGKLWKVSGWRWNNDQRASTAFFFFFFGYFAGKGV